MANIICKFTGKILGKAESSLPTAIAKDGNFYSIHPVFLLDNKDFLKYFHQSLKGFHVEQCKVFAISAIHRMGMFDNHSSNYTQQPVKIHVKNKSQFYALALIAEIYFNLDEKSKKIISKSLPTFSDFISFSVLAKRFYSAFSNAQRISPKIEYLTSQLDMVAVAQEKESQEDLIDSFMEDLKSEIAAISKPARKNTSKAAEIRRQLPTELLIDLQLSIAQTNLIVDTYNLKQDKLFTKYTMENIIAVQNCIHSQIPDLSNDQLFALTDLDLHLATILKRYGAKLSAFGLEIKKQEVKRKIADKNITFDILSQVTPEIKTESVKPKKFSAAEMRILLRK